VNTIEEWRVSFAERRDFHKLINTCVEIFMLPQYVLRGSAQVLLSSSAEFCADLPNAKVVRRKFFDE
jgi:hypothetical protein